MGESLLIAFVFIAGGLIAVPLATRFGLGSVLGYLIAGVALAPALEAAGVNVTTIQHFAEFGVVMMLFLVGLELEPKMLWSMRNRILGLGGLQVAATTAVVTGAAMALGQTWQVALACGLILSLSSTAIVLQTLGEKGLMQSDGGQSSFTILLFQDIAVIPMLALMPLLASQDLLDAAHHSDDAHHAFSLVEGRPGWQVAIITLAAVTAVVAIGFFLVGPLFRFVAQAKLRELFIATALALVVGIAVLMELVGLSPALGAFIAGVVLANSPYKHELESDIDPIRGLLLGLFFITVGAGINFQTLLSNFGTVVGLTIGLMLTKALIVLILARRFSLRGADKWLVGLGLAQAGEFGFVLLSFTTSNAILPQSVADILLLVVTLSMMITPVLFILYERVIAPRYDTAEEREADEVTEQGDVIIAGHGHFGTVVNRVMLMAGHNTTVLDYSSERLDMMRKWGIKAFYGDASRPDMLKAAGIDNAKMLIVAIDDYHKALHMVRWVRRHHPDVKIVARALNMGHAFDLDLAGVDHCVRQYFEGSVRVARIACEELGMHPFDAELLGRVFMDEDEIVIRELSHLYTPNEQITPDSPFAKRFMEIRADRDRQLSARGAVFRERTERGWNPPVQEDIEAILRET